MNEDSPQPPPHLSSLREVFPGFFPPNDDQMRAFLMVGMVVLDSNTLLDAYKLTGTARAEFFETIRLLGDRLFIPHQVGLEFLRQRATVIKASTDFPARFREAAKKLHGEVQSLKEHRRLRDEEVSGMESAINGAIDDLLERHADLYDFGVSLESSIEQDPLFEEIEQLTSGKIGPPFAKPVEMARVGSQRLKESVPPGYADHAKEPAKALGDFFLWEQTILEAEKRQLPVLIVSNDGKEDWVRKENGRARGPRPELIDEMLARTGQPFHRVNVKSFLTLAKIHLSAHVSEATIKEAESVQEQASEPRAFRASQDRSIHRLLSNLSEADRDLLLHDFASSIEQSRERSPWAYDASKNIPYELYDLSIPISGLSDDDPHSRYGVLSPGGQMLKPPPGKGWRISENMFLELDGAGKIYWGPDGNSTPRQIIAKPKRPDYYYS